METDSRLLLLWIIVKAVSDSHGKDAALMSYPDRMEALQLATEWHPFAGQIDLMLAMWEVAAKGRVPADCASGATYDNLERLATLTARGSTFTVAVSK